jgi:hypothetical protein
MSSLSNWKYGLSKNSGSDILKPFASIIIVVKDADLFLPLIMNDIVL